MFWKIKPDGRTWDNYILGTKLFQHNINAFGNLHFILFLFLYNLEAYLTWLIVTTKLCQVYFLFFHIKKILKFRDVDLFRCKGKHMAVQIKSTVNCKHFQLDVYFFFSLFSDIFLWLWRHFFQWFWNIFLVICTLRIIYNFEVRTPKVMSISLPSLIYQDYFINSNFENNPSINFS